MLMRHDDESDPFFGIVAEQTEVDLPDPGGTWTMAVFNFCTIEHFSELHSESGMVSDMNGRNFYPGLWF